MGVHMTESFGLAVLFTLKEGTGEAFDRLVAETVSGIRDAEPGTLVYACHRVQGEPDQRLFYELYRDMGAFEEHERRPHTRRFLAEREKYVAHIEVHRLTPFDGKGYGDEW